MGTAKKAKKVKRKAKKAKVTGSKWQVWHGTRKKTVGGLVKADLCLNKRGKVVSKKQTSHGKKVYKKNGLNKWTTAFMQARKNLGITGFVLCKKTSALYKEAKKIYTA